MTDFTLWEKRYINVVLVDKVNENIMVRAIFRGLLITQGVFRSTALTAVVQR